MSHLIVRVSSIRDINVVQTACLELGWTLTTGGRVMYYSGLGPDMDFTIALNDGRKYNIGLTWNHQNSTYDVHMDNAMKGMNVYDEDKMDTMSTKILGQLNQTYQVHMVRHIAQRTHGHKLMREITDQEGNRWLEVSVQG